MNLFALNTKFKINDLFQFNLIQIIIQQTQIIYEFCSVVFKIVFPNCFSCIITINELRASAIESRTQISI